MVSKWIGFFCEWGGGCVCFCFRLVYVLGNSIKYLDG